MNARTITEPADPARGISKIGIRFVSSDPFDLEIKQAVSGASWFCAGSLRGLLVSAVCAARASRRFTLVNNPGTHARRRAGKMLELVRQDLD